MSVNFSPTETDYNEEPELSDIASDPLLSQYSETEEGNDEPNITPRCNEKKIRNYWLQLVLILASVIVILLVFVLGIIVGYYIPHSNKAFSTQKDSICANPPLLIVSMDGFRADYLQRGVTPNIQKLADDGVQTPYMKPAFPSKTFPNHYTIVTGLYPESHGIVANHFYSRTFKDLFYIGAPTYLDPKWWKGEPIWRTASKQSLRTAVYYWPGSEVPGLIPDVYFKYNRSVPFYERVETVLSWFDLPDETRPQLMALYFGEPDHTAHQYGPNTTQVNEALAQVDDSISQLVEGMKQKNIYDCVNLIIVSDHGMATLDNSKIHTLFPQLLPRDYYSKLENVTYGIFSQLYVKHMSDIQEIYEIITENINAFNATLDVYLRDEVPEELHVGHYNQDRYGDIIIISHLHGFLKLHSEDRRPSIGEHGYDNSQPLMRAVFISHGPAFKANYHAGPVQNIDVYELMCNILHINPAPNNGSLSRISDVLKS